MYVVTGGETYTRIANLSFIPETNVAGTALPVNEFVVDIHTDDTIRNGADVFLYDDMENLWAKYWIVSAEQVEQEEESGEGIVRVRGQSKIILLERVTLPPVMYSGTALSTVLAAIFASLGSGEYTVDASFSSETITGFCPEQTARDRLLWVCFVIGAYVKTYFTDTVEILPIDDTEVMVPLDRTYWKPSATYGDYVTAVKAKVYSFTQGTPQTTDQWVTDGTNYYIVTAQEVTLSNPDVPVTAAANTVSVEDCMLVNQSNADDVLSHLAKYYFDRVQVDLDVIDNAEYMPGQKLLVYSDEDTMVSGYAEKCSFTFGLQAKATIHLMASAEKESGALTIYYMYLTRQIGKKHYSFPVGYQYSVANPYIDIFMDWHRYVFRPLNEYATGTIASGENTNTQQCAVALDLDRSTGILHIISVDEVNDEQSGDIMVGVIS